MPQARVSPLTLRPSHSGDAHASTAGSGTRGAASVTGDVQPWTRHC